MKLLALLFAATGALAFGQAAGTSFSGPVTGFLPTQTPNELLPIRGVPGAARLGDAIRLPNTVTQIYLAPKQRYALAAQGETDPVALVVLRGAGGIEAAPILTPLSGAIAHPDLVAFSPNGGTAALYSGETKRIQVFAGLPGAPRLAQQVSDVSLAGSARALAVSDDAEAVLIADTTGTVYSVSSNGSPVAVYHASQVAALEFVSQSHDAIVCDPALGSAAILESGSVRTVQPPSDAGCQPSAAASTADGKTMLIACPAQHSIWSVNLATGSTSVRIVNTGVTTLDRLGAADSFLMSPADANGTYWVITWQADGPATSFIGAARGN